MQLGLPTHFAILIWDNDVQDNEVQLYLILSQEKSLLKSKIIAIHMYLRLSDMVLSE